MDGGLAYHGYPNLSWNATKLKSGIADNLGRFKTLKKSEKDIEARADQALDLSMKCVTLLLLVTGSLNLNCGIQGAPCQLTRQMITVFMILAATILIPPTCIAILKLVKVIGLLSRHNTRRCAVVREATIIKEWFYRLELESIEAIAGAVELNEEEYYRSELKAILSCKTDVTTLYSCIGENSEDLKISICYNMVLIFNCVVPTFVGVVVPLLVYHSFCKE